MRTVFLFLLSLFSQTSQATIFPKVVSTLDLEQYLGTWYEIASTKPGFQKDCVCVTANYHLQPDGKVYVANTCRKKDVNAPEEIAEGLAEATSNPAKFKVSFGGFRFPFANYWVVDLADDYSYAVVSTPFRRPIWVLSKTPSLPQETLEGIYARLRAQNFPVDSISPTLQDGCPREARIF